MSRAEVSPDEDGGEDDWWALLGPAPHLLFGAIDWTPHDKTRRLSGPHELGEVVLRPGGELLVEYFRNEPLDLEGETEFESWPIIVEGATPSGVHLEHDTLTAHRVARVSVLCSLAWSEPWRVRTAPCRTSRLPPRVPKNWPAPPAAFRDPPHASALISSDPCAYPPFTLPQWLGAGWQSLDADEALCRAAFTWHEALLMQNEHPSFSAIAYLSAVDALAHSDWAAARFELKRLGPRERVRTLLSSVVGDDEGAALIERAYDRRNETNHQGWLFGTETSRGAFSPLLFDHVAQGDQVAWILQPDPEDAVFGFLQGTLVPLAAVVRTLLIGALGG
jgi:hypothetical protein